MNHFSFYLGIDVSKSWLDVAVLEPAKGIIYENRIDNTFQAIKDFIKGIKKLVNSDCTSILFCLEQTGKYGNAFLNVSTELRLNTWVELPLQIKRSQGIVRGKSDKLDARRIAEYAYRFSDKVRLWRPANKSISDLQDLKRKRDQLVKVATQLKIGGDKDPIMDKPLKAIEKAIKDLEQQMDKLIVEDEKYEQQYRLLQTIPGIGRQTALALLITTQGFTRLTDKRKLSCYAGLAPFPYSSGSSIKGKSRISKMGDMRLKSLLNLSAWNAIRSITELKNYFNKKVAQGKHKLSVINAIRNKLIGMALSVIKREKPFTKEYLVALT